MTDSDIKEVLLRVIIRTASDGGTLDAEDQEMLVRCHMGRITHDALDAFAMMKAARLEQQLNQPQ